MAYLGSWKIDDYLTFYANTHRFDTGAATDADTVPSYRVYEDETGTVVENDVMALLDSSNTAGYYSEQIQLTAAKGYEKGKQYSIYISATVNSVTGTLHHTFQMEAEVDANVVSGTVTLADDGITAAKIAAGAIDAASIAADVWTRLGIVAYGTAQAAAAASIQLAASSAFADDELNGAVVVITGGTTGVGQSRVITNYTSSTDTADVDTWTTTPTGTITYVVFAAAPASATSVPAVNVTQWNGSAIATPTTAGVPEVDLTHVAGTAVTASAGRPEVNVTHAAGTAWGSGAITAASVAADAVTEIQSGLATAASLSTVAGYIDTEVASILAAVDTEVAAIKAKTDNLPAAPAATGDIPTVTQIWQRVIEGSITAEQLLRALLAFAAGQATGGGTTSPAFRDQADTKDRIAMTVDTATGDRSAVTLDLT